MSNVSSSLPTSPITLPIDTLTPGALQIIQTSGGTLSYKQSQALTLDDTEDLPYTRRMLHEAEQESADYITDAVQKLRPADSIIINYRDRDAMHLQPDAPLTWYVKPLDGMQNFEHGYSLFTVALTVVETKTQRLRFTGVYAPQYQRTWWVTGGKPYRKLGRRQREQQLQPYNFSNLTVIGTNYPRNKALRHAYLGLLPNITDRFQHLRMLGSGSLQGILVAEGRMNALIEFDVKPATYLPTRELIRLTDGLSELVTMPDGSTALVAARHPHDFDFLLGLVQGLS